MINGMKIPPEMMKTGGLRMKTTADINITLRMYVLCALYFLKSMPALQSQVIDLSAGYIYDM